jgi:Ca2+-binding RTX toxin-like protein
MTLSLSIRRSRRILTTAAVLTLCLPADARAIDDQWPAVGTCEWPTSIQILMTAAASNPALEGDFACAGAYVGNDMVLTAAHCIAEAESISVLFGEDLDDPFWTDNSPTCAVHPDGAWVLQAMPGEDAYRYEGKDIGYCILSAGHPNPPYIAPLVPNGCETNYLRDALFGEESGPYGADIEYVASGLESGDLDGPAGTKRNGPGSVLFEWYYPDIDSLVVVLLQPNNESGVGDIAVRLGDSGGPVYFETPNDTWRMVGTISKAGELQFNLGDGLGQIKREHVLAASTPRYLRWIEQDSGKSVTPCHTWSGSSWAWSGVGLCASSYDTSPSDSTSSWPNCTSTTPGTTATECSGWTPPGPGNKTAPTTADGIQHALINGPTAIPPDTWFFGTPRLPEVLGTGGNDNLTTSQASEIVGGRGNDSIFAGASGDELHGGVGNDLLVGGGGTDVLVPGRGTDQVQGQGGNDVILITGTCELAAGEILNGGPGFDVVRAPVNGAGLSSLGVSLVGIEQVIVNHPDIEAARCQFGS